MSVCLSTVSNSVPLTNKLTKFKNKSLGDDTLTTLDLQVHLWLPHTSLTSHAPGGGTGLKCRTWRFLPYFDFVAAGVSVFHKHMSIFTCNSIIICPMVKFLWQRDLIFLASGWRYCLIRAVLVPSGKYTGSFMKAS